MSESENDGVPDRPGSAGLIRALNVRHNAGVGIVVGVAFAAAVYAVRVFELLGPAPEGEGGPVLFAMLGFVLAFGVFVLVTVALTLVAAYRRTREFREDEPAGGRD